jgi:hypothetical protein
MKQYMGTRRIWTATAYLAVSSALCNSIYFYIGPKLHVQLVTWQNRDPPNIITSYMEQVYTSKYLYLLQVLYQYFGTYFQCWTALQGCRNQAIMDHFTSLLFLLHGQWQSYSCTQRDSWSNNQQLPVYDSAFPTRPVFLTLYTSLRWNFTTNLPALLGWGG